MSRQPSKFVRAIVPIILALVVVGVGAAVLINSSGRGTSLPTPQPAAQPPASTPSTPVASQQTPSQPSPQVGEPVVPAPTPAAPTLSGLHAVPVGAPVGGMGSIGDHDPASPYRLRAEFSEIGAGIRRITLAEHWETIRRVRHVVVQHERVQGGVGVTPFAALGIYIEGQYVSLAGTTASPVWRIVDPGAFDAIVADGDGNPVVRIERRYELDHGTHDMHVGQRVVNLTHHPLRIRWRQFGPAEFDPDPVQTYGGDMRRIRFGYLLRPSQDPLRQHVLAVDFLWNRSAGSVLGPKNGGFHPQVHEIWPNSRSVQQQYELAWVGVTNRYFCAAMHAAPDPSQASPDKVLRLGQTVERVLLNHQDPASTIVLRLTSEEFIAPAGGDVRLDFGLFGGPQSRGEMYRRDTAMDRLKALGLGGIVVHNFGGLCAGCTFPWLTGPLLALLHLLHDYILFDWALSIIFLVVIVRGLLHPITRWSQIRIQRFGKQMQALAPKQKKIQEKYGGDRKKMQEEMTKLWREEGVNPMGMMGCLPLFLQSPIWIALYAMLFFAVELRHQPAFFGVFQFITAGKWWFLSDLGEPDRAIYFGRAVFSLPLLGGISSFNLLPLILGVVFWAHQKYLSPPTAGPLTPEQEQQQKIIKVMMVVMFPIIMYNAPSGLALYFIANSTIAIFENRWIRAHIDKHDLLNPAKKPARRQGFIEHLRQVAEDRQKASAKARDPRLPPRRRDKGR